MFTLFVDKQPSLCQQSEATAPTAAFHDVRQGRGKRDAAVARSAQDAVGVLRTQTRRRIQKVDPPILDASTPMVFRLQNLKADLLILDLNTPMV